MDTEERQTTQGPPIACSLPEDRVRERREELSRYLFAGSTASRDLSDGYEYVFPGDAAWAERLMRVVVEERECCRFLSFEIAFEPDRGPIRLRIRGPEGVKGFLSGTPGEGA